MTFLFVYDRVFDYNSSVKPQFYELSFCSKTRGLWPDLV